MQQGPCLSIPLSCWEIRGIGIEIEIYKQSKTSL